MSLVIRGDREYRFPEHSLRHNYREDELLVTRTKPPEPRLCPLYERQAVQTRSDCRWQRRYCRDDATSVRNK